MKPVIVELTDFKTKEKVDELEVDAVLVATGRAPYTQVWPGTAWKLHLMHIAASPSMLPSEDCVSRRRAWLICTPQSGCARLLGGHTFELALQGLNLGAINAETDRRGFVPVSEQMEVLDKSGKPVSNVYCIGDANGEHLHCRCILTAL